MLGYFQIFCLLCFHFFLPLLPSPTVEFHFFPMFQCLFSLVILHTIPNLGIFFFFFFYKSCSQSTFWNTSSKGLIWLRLSLSYDQEKSGVCFMFSWWKAKGWAVPWKVIRPFQEARNGWGRGGEQAQVWCTSRKLVIYYVTTVTSF